MTPPARTHHAVIFQALAPIYRPRWPPAEHLCDSKFGPIVTSTCIGAECYRDLPKGRASFQARVGHAVRAKHHLLRGQRRGEGWRPWGMLHRRWGKVRRGVCCHGDTACGSLGHEDSVVQRETHACYQQVRMEQVRSISSTGHSEGTFLN